MEMVHTTEPDQATAAAAIPTLRSTPNEREQFLESSQSDKKIACGRMVGMRP
jgi:hypothetical protein